MLTVLDGLRDTPSRTLILEAGRPLFHVGDPVRTVYIVRTGLIHLIRHQSDGSALILQKGGQGSIVAEASVYAERYHCDAIASTATQVTAISKPDFLRRLRRDPALADAWEKHLAHELQKARLHSEILSIKTVAKRLDAWMASHDGVEPRKGAWKLVAYEIGATPEALYREMGRRRRAGGAGQPDTRRIHLAAPSMV